MTANNQITVALTAQDISNPGIPVAIGDPVSLSKAMSIPSKWEVTSALGKIARIGGANAKQIDFRIRHQGSPNAWVSAVHPQLEVTIQFNPRLPNPVPAPRSPTGTSHPAVIFFSVLAAVIVGACLLIYATQHTPDSSGQSPSTNAAPSDAPQGADGSNDGGNADAPAPSDPKPPTLPSDLIAFDKANAAAMAAYPQADNDLKKTEIKQARDANAMAALQGGAFSSWPGTLKTLGTTGDGDAYIAVQLDGCGCTLETTNNSFSEAINEANGKSTLIKKGSPLYVTLREMHEGDRVTVSGRIFTETSLPEGGSITDPAWETAFTDVAPETKQEGQP